VRRLLPALILLALSGCASRRLLVVENDLLRDRVGELEARVAELEKDLPNPDDYARPVDLAIVDRWLDRAGYVHTYNQSGQGHVRLEFAGRNTSFSVSIQHFPSRNVLFMATSGYLRLEEAQSIESVVLLLVQIASLNYDLLVGKFQMNPETGEILLSTELYVQEGVAYATFLQALDSLCATADDRYPDLERAIEGLGI
jgi:hypothetical protein